MELIPVLFAGATVALAYASLPTPSTHAQLSIDKTPPPIYELSSYYGFSSDTIRFNKAKRPELGYTGQFGIVEDLIPDGLGCLVRTGNVGIDNF